jgi:hypothetical protein
MSTSPNSPAAVIESAPNPRTLIERPPAHFVSAANGARSVSPFERVRPMKRKRRTVLWLYQEDYEYLSAVAEHDMDSKNISMHRLVKALRAANVKSFLRIEEVLRRLPPPSGKV